MKKGVKILLGIVLLIIIIVLYFVISKSLETNKCIKIINEEDYFITRISKCNSLCPREINSNFSIPYSDCLYYCFKSSESSRPDYNDIESCLKIKKVNDIFKNFNDELVKCNQYKSNQDNYKLCYNDFIKKYSFISNLSNLNLGNYQKFNLSLENYNCSKNPIEISLKLVEGIDNLNLTIYVNNINYTNTITPAVGKSMTYYIDNYNNIESSYNNNMEIRYIIRKDNIVVYYSKPIIC